MVLDKGYSCFTVSNGDPSFPFAAMKKFDYQVTKDNCKPITSCCNHPCKIYIYNRPGMPKKPEPVVHSDWECYQNIDMCGQGDHKIIGDWAEYHSLDDLKALCIHNGCQAMSVDLSGKFFQIAALKKFDYELTKEHCKPTDGYENTFYIFKGEL